MNTLRSLMAGILMMLALITVPVAALAAFDTTQPTTSATLTGTKGSDGWYTTSVTVTLVAADGADGSGVAKTEYSLDNVTWQTYAAPFVVNIDGKSTVYFRSTDTAGNVESPAKSQEIKINKTGLVGLWHMDNNWLDSSVVRNDGTPYNGVTFSSNAKIGTNAGNFDGVDDYVRIANSSSLNPINQITVAAWYNPRSFSGSGNDCIVDKGYTSHTAPYYQYHLGVSGNQYLDNPATFSFSVGTGGQYHGAWTAPNSWIPGNWYYLAGTYDGATVKIYINGILAKSSPATGTFTDYGKDLYIGRFGNLASYLPGLIDDVRIYNRALSDTEILEHYRNYVVKSPTVNPAPSPTATSAITLSGTKSANTAIVVNGNTLVPIDGTTSWQTSYTLSQGMNTISITALDSQNFNSLPVILPVILDTTPPQVTATTPVNNGMFKTAPASVTFTLADALSTLDYTATLNLATVTNASGFNVSGTWSNSGSGATGTITFTPTSTLSEGTYTFVIKPTDTLANRSTYTLIFTIDSTPPVAPGIDLATAPINTTSKTITGTRSSDSASVAVSCAGATIGIISYPTATTWSVNVSGLKEGSNTITASAVDTAGNPSATATATITVDTIPPAVGATPAGGIYNSTQGVALATNEPAVIYYTMDGSTPTAGATTYGQPISIPASANLTYFARDLAGNNSEIKTENYVIDTTPPLLAISTLSNGAYTNNEILNIAGTVTDNTGVKGITVNDTAVQVNADGSFSYVLLLKNGVNVVTVAATDLAGNQAVDTRTITLDQTAPQLTVLMPADNAKTNTALLTVSGTVDKTSSVTTRLGDTVQFAALDGGTFTAPVNLVSGYNTIEITATDLAGNRGSQKRTVIFDDQKPSLAVTEPNQDIKTNQGSLAIKGTVFDALTAVNVTISKDGDTFVPPVVNGTFEQTVTFREEKAYGILVTATNEAGTSTSVQRNIIYDTTPPVLSIDAVASPTSQPNQSISGKREADTAVAVTCSTAAVGEVSYPTAPTWETNITGLTGGENVVTATSTDAAGNPATASAKIVLATKPLEVTVSATPDVIWPPNHKLVPVKIGGRVLANGADVQSVSITVRDEYGKYNYNNLKFGDTVLLEAWRDGDDREGRIYTITAIAVDKAGNSTKQSTTVVVPHEKSK